MLSLSLSMLLEVSLLPLLPLLVLLALLVPRRFVAACAHRHMRPTRVSQRHVRHSISSRELRTMHRL